MVGVGEEERRLWSEWVLGKEERWVWSGWEKRRGGLGRGGERGEMVKVGMGKVGP